MVAKDFKRFMNHRAPANSRYKPTCYEHAANCYTHAFLIAPSIVGSALLHRMSDDRWEKITAWIYGMGLCTLFIVSTVFHIVTWKKSHLRTVEHCFHMCDRMVIYFFIAASYAPWLNLRELGPLASHMRWLIWLMAAGGTIYVFLYHENFQQWQVIAGDFESLWNFTNCGGAIDGKHVRIMPPSKSGSYYYNYKDFFSIILMAIVDTNYEFLFVEKIGRCQMAER
ncbi:monocyte to macrophage differentiation factor isoform X4 [Mixophyes fleayi]|uniref:monocyte to macrophage differentiation factor isoform X4 n=1 Tax=Mixophyes fleayi TaxID=3061075 RepID=UPI003F4DC6E0